VGRDLVHGAVGLEEGDCRLALLSFRRGERR
jgi:hypothetical protein